MAENRIAFETRGCGPAVLVLHGGRLDRHHMIDALEPAFVNGRQDAMAGYAEAMALLPAYPNATFAALDTAGHGLAWERPALFKALVRDWLGRLAVGFGS